MSDTRPSLKAILEEGKRFKANKPTYKGKNYAANLWDFYKLYMHSRKPDEALKAAAELCDDAVKAGNISEYGVETGFGGSKINDPNWLNIVEDFKKFVKDHEDAIKAMKEATGRTPAIYPKKVDSDKAAKFDAANVNGK